MKPVILGLLAATLAFGQDTDTLDERWNLYWQATSVGQYHGTFKSPYQGQNSLLNAQERDVSLTSTSALAPIKRISRAI
jgi:hypothetical protein